jgi:hypothetical protein
VVAGNSEQNRTDFDDCRRDPELHDLLSDGSRSRRSDFQSAQSDLESKMDDLDSRLHSVQDSCAYEFTLNRMSSLEAAQRRLCTSYRRFIAFGLSPENVLQMCKANSSDEGWCKACLGLKCPPQPPSLPHPALFEAGLADHVWSLEEIVHLAA